MRAGKVKGKIIDYTLGETKEGHMKALVQFKTEDDEKVMWTGLFHTQGSLDRTLKALIIMGLSTNDLSNMVDGPSNQMLNLKEEFELLVEEQVYKDKENKDRTIYQVSFVNKIGLVGTVTREKAFEKFKEHGIVAALAALGFKKSTTEIPF